MEYKRVPIPGYEGYYEIDTNGVVYSLKKNKKLKPWLTYAGYHEIYLHKDGKRIVTTVHRLVAKTFIPNPDNLPCINHKDEVKTNNSVSNLEWCTHWYNIHYGTGIERGVKGRSWFRRSPEQNKEHSEKMKRYKRDMSPFIIVCLNDGKTFPTYTDVSIEYGIERRTVKKVCDTGVPMRCGLAFKRIEKRGEDD